MSCMSCISCRRCHSAVDISKPSMMEVDMAHTSSDISVCHSYTASQALLALVCSSATRRLVPYQLLHCRLTKQVSAFYDDVLRLLSNAPLNAHFDKSWTSHVQVKATLYDVESQIQQSAQSHKDDDIAPEIARLKVLTAFLLVDSALQHLPC